VHALRGRMPELRISVRTSLPRAIVAGRLGDDFAYLPGAADVGLIMASAMEVRVEESARAYADFHRGWKAKVAGEAQVLTRLSPDLVLADVPYLVLAASARSGIPAVAMCSLNWADVYWHYCAARPEAAEIRAEILGAYESAACFLLPEPAMPMEGLPNRRLIGSIARRGRRQRAEIDRALGLGPGHRLVLVALGGIPSRLPLERWPRLPGVVWLVPAEWAGAHPDAVPLEGLRMSFVDILASCDILLTKTGYGSFTEAVANGIRVLYVARPDWPEEPYLAAWLARNGQCRSLHASQLADGGLIEPLQQLLQQAAPLPQQPDGAGQAAELICARLSG
jgi:hypothetical protein